MIGAKKILIDKRNIYNSLLIFHPMIRLFRVFSIIDSEEFEKAFFSWTSLKMKEISKREIVSIDGNQMTGPKCVGVV